MVVVVCDSPLGKAKIDNMIIATKDVETNELRETFNDRITPLRTIGGGSYLSVVTCGIFTNLRP